MLFTTAGLGDHISRRDPLRRDDPPVGEGRHAFHEGARGRRRHPGHQGRQGREAARRAPGRDGHRGPRRPPRAAGRVPGARARKFTKWRAVIAIDGDRIPSAYCIHVNAHALARYAALSQEAGLVPIVEPEVLMDGDHTIERCYEVTEATLQAVFNELFSSASSRGDAAEAEHGHLRQGLPAAGRPRRGGRKRRSAASGASSPRPCRGSSSSRAARATRRRPRT